MISSTTQTITLPTQEVLRVRLESNQSSFNPQEHLLALIQEMRDSGLFLDQEMADWEKDFSSMNFSHDEEKISNTQLLCYFLVKVIYTKTLNEQSAQNETKILLFEEKLKKVLQFLESNESVIESFIDQAIRIKNEVQTHLNPQKLAKVEDIVKEEKRKTSRSANEVNREIRTDFEEIKSEQMAWHGSREEEVERSHQTVDALTNRAAQQVETTLSQIENIRKLDADLDAEETHLHRIV